MFEDKNDFYKKKEKEATVWSLVVLSVMFITAIAIIYLLLYRV